MPPPQGQNPFAQGQNVYGQQPPPQGGYGYPPQQGYPPQGQPGMPQQQSPYFNQGAPVPPPAPRRRFGKGAIRIIGVLVVAVIVGILKFGAGWFLTRDDAETTSVGACMHNDGTEINPDLKEVDCSSSGAEFKVIKKFDGTSDQTKCDGITEISYYQSGGGHSVVLCLEETS